MTETTQARRRRAEQILRRLRSLYPEAECELEFRDPFELLIATILSAQTTDKAVNAVTPALFARYPGPEALAEAVPEDVEELIGRIGLFRTKARSIIGAARQIVERFGGRVPADRELLESLPGVGRKTANVVLPNAFGIPGLAVDTHVSRLSRRLGLSRHSDPARIERELTEIYEDRHWRFVSHALIWHGRRVCASRRPDCGTCRLADLCPSRDAATAGAPSRRSVRGRNSEQAR